MTVKASGAHAAEKPLEALDIVRRAPGDHEVQIEIAYCGVCHSDLHTVRGEWAGTQFPSVPGHEIVGRVTAVGPKVTKFSVGDIVKGTVTKIASFGAFVQLQDDIDGLVHISQLADEHVARVKDVIKVGQEVEVDLQVLYRDDEGVDHWIWTWAPSAPKGAR